MLTRSRLEYERLFGCSGAAEDGGIGPFRLARALRFIRLFRVSQSYLLERAGGAESLAKLLC
jgi:hypothetical protein